MEQHTRIQESRAFLFVVSISESVSAFSQFHNLNVRNVMKKSQGSNACASIPSIFVEIQENGNKNITESEIYVEILKH